MKKIIAFLIVSLVLLVIAAGAGAAEAVEKEQNNITTPPPPPEINKEYLQPAQIVVGYDYDYVCRVVMAESGGHSEELQLAICQAIINRCKKTLENPEEVCRGCYTTPAEKASDGVLNACERVFLLGEEYYGIGNADLMYNPDIAGHSEFHEGQTYVTTIDGVKFFEEGSNE